MWPGRIIYASKYAIEVLKLFLGDFKISTGPLKRNLCWPTVPRFRKATGLQSFGKKTPLTFRDRFSRPQRTFICSSAKLNTRLRTICLQLMHFSVEPIFPPDEWFQLWPSLCKIRSFTGKAYYVISQ